MSANDTPNIAGGWLGTYYYRGAQSTNSPMRFEASFAVGMSGQFDGTIQDDSRLLGRANVRGVQLGRTVRFSKAYQKVVPGGRTLRVEYEGAFADNGHAIAGTWRAMTICNVPLPWAHGTWEARRAWMAEEEPEAVPEKQSNEHVMREAALA